MYQHRFHVDIDFDGEVDHIPDDTSVKEVEYMLVNLIKGFFFIEEDGHSVIPFDPETLNVNVRALIEEVKHER